MSAEIIKEAKAYRRADAALVKHRERLAELFKQARDAEGIGPADLARLVDYLYTPDHISRLTNPKPKPPPKKRRAPRGGAVRQAASPAADTES